MNVRDLERLYDYNYWANKQLFDVVAKLTPEQFTRQSGGGHSSIRNTLVHVMSAEWGWLDRCGGHARGPKLEPNDFPTVESVTGTWRRVEGYVREFLRTLRDEDLKRDVEFTLGALGTKSLALGDLLHHSLVHAAHHRGQAALLLRELDQAPPSFDFVIFCGEERR